MEYMYKLMKMLDGSSVLQKGNTVPNFEPPTHGCHERKVIYSPEKSEVEQNNGKELLEVMLLKKATQCLLIM